MFSWYYQLEKAKKKEAAFIVTFAKREQEIAELKVSPSHTQFAVEDGEGLSLLFIFSLYTLNAGSHNRCNCLGSNIY
jgi:hypothetical protein